MKERATKFFLALMCIPILLVVIALLLFITLFLPLIALIKPNLINIKRGKKLDGSLLIHIRG